MPDPAWHRVAAEADLKPETPRAVRVGKTQIALVKLADGIFAVSDVCTHEYALLSDGFCEHGKLECPLHQALFDIRTGKAETEPADVDLQVFPVKVEGGQVFVQV